MGKVSQVRVANYISGDILYTFSVQTTPSYEEVTFAFHDSLKKLELAVDRTERSLIIPLNFKEVCVTIYIVHNFLNKSIFELFFN